jgi:hypothetical protein
VIYVCAERLRLRLGRLVRLLLPFKIGGARLPIQACLAVQEVVLLDWATAALLVLGILAVVVECRRGWGNVWDLLWYGVLAADGSDADV